MNNDELRPLKWYDFAGAPGWHMWSARTPVANYTVVQWEHRFRWGYSYYWESQSIEVASLEEGQQKCWEHWKNLVRQIVEPHPLDGTTITATPTVTSLPQTE